MIQQVATHTQLTDQVQINCQTKRSRDGLAQHRTALQIVPSFACAATVSLLHPTVQVNAALTHQRESRDAGDAVASDLVVAAAEGRNHEAGCSLGEVASCTVLAVAGYADLEAVGD